jgi:hypothetical protein
MQAGIDMRCFLATVYLTLCAATANAALITYDVDRTIGDGSVTGFIETDGTLGNGLSPNIMKDWSLTLIVPDLVDPGVEFTATIDPGNSNLIFGSSVINATETELSFDFGLAGNDYMLFSGGTTELFWCMETSAGGCNGPDSSEHIGVNGVAFYSVPHTGEIVFATATVVPVPAAAWLFGSGLIGLAGIARRKR